MKRKLIKTKNRVYERMGEFYTEFYPKRTKKSKKEKTWTRAGKMNRHHIVNKCRGGTWATTNILKMDINRHNAWHFLFQNMSFEEVILLLQRTIQMKQDEKEI